jgi:hypothetical protein
MNHKRGNKMAEEHEEAEATEKNSKQFQVHLQLPRRGKGR